MDEAFICHIFFLQLLLFCSYSFSFIKYYLVFIISQSDFIAFFMSVLSVLNVQHPVLQCLIRLVHIEHHVKSVTSAKSEDV